MNDQHDLFLTPMRYPNAPGHRRVDTSVAAARSMLPHFNRLQKIVLDFIASQGARGATYTEVMAGTGLGAPTIAARIRELRELKSIERTGQKRVTPSGREAHVWRTT